MKKKWTGNKASFSLCYPIVIPAMIGVIVLIFMGKGFLPRTNWTGFLGDASIRLLIALGVSGCMISKGFDLSAGAQMGFAACLSGLLCQMDDYPGKLWKLIPEMNRYEALGIVLGIGLLFGLLNGLIIAWLRAPSFLATLGTQTIISAMALILTNGSPIGGLNKEFKALGNGTIQIGGTLDVPYLLLAALLIGLIFALIDHKTRHGKRMFEIGTNEAAAKASGVPVKHTMIGIYMTAGFLYALAGYLLAARTGSVSASAGTGYELEALLACVIGGVSVCGGMGTVPGVFVGVAVYELIKAMLRFAGIHTYYLNILLGILIVMAVALDIRKNTAKRSKQETGSQISKNA